MKENKLDYGSIPGMPLVEEDVRCTRCGKPVAWNRLSQRYSKLAYKYCSCRELKEPNQ